MECPGHEDTTAHSLGECPAFGLIRQELLGDFFMKPHEIMDVKLIKIVNFINQTGRLDGDDLFIDPLDSD